MAGEREKNSCHVIVLARIEEREKLLSLLDWRGNSKTGKKGEIPILHGST